ncbi:uncharacterized protein [Dermacentor andersoni]|uniref:uncharacterized protein n=1 Tax=Dermacentor andersoni TaxID=34620 RepID=UPI003B3A09B3
MAQHNVSAVDEAATRQPAANLEDQLAKLMRSAMRLAMPIAQEVMAQGTVSPACISSLLVLYKGLARYEIWALKFVESVGIPAGVLEMNSGSLGRYDECLGIAVPEGANSSLVAFRGSFCSVFLKAQGNPFLRKLIRRVFENTPEMKKRIGSFEEFESLQENPYQLGLRAALCAPSTCAAADMESLLAAAAEPYGVQVKVPVCTDSSPTTLGADQVFALCALVCLLAAVILASAVDLWLRYSPRTNQSAFKDSKTTKSQLLLAFSAVTNTQRLFDLDAGAGGRLRCLDGVRFLSAAWVVLLHNYVVAEPNSIACGKTFVQRLVMDLCNRFTDGGRANMNAYVACATKEKAAVALGGVTVNAAFKLTMSMRQQERGLGNGDPNSFHTTFRHVRCVSTDEVRVAVLWVVAIAVTTLVCLFPFVWNSAAIPYDPALAAVYASLYPLLWSVSVTWMLHSCITGTGDLVNRFLSMGVFMPLGKLSFSLYLVHPYVLYTKLITTRQFRALDQWTMFTDAIGLLFFSLFFAFVFYITCECPITNIDKIAVDAILKGRRRDIKNEVPTSNVHSNNIELSGCTSTSP